MDLHWELQPDNSGGVDSESYYTHIIFDDADWQLLKPLERRLEENHEALEKRGINYEFNGGSIKFTYCVTRKGFRRFMNRGELFPPGERPSEIQASRGRINVIVTEDYL